MKFEKVAPIAELLSSIAVLITLVYLAIQTQQTNQALLANSRQATVTSDMMFIDTIVSNPEAWANLERPWEELNPAEQGQVGNVLAGMLRTREFVFLQYQNGAIDEATLRSYLAPMPRWLRFPAIQPVLEEFRLEMDKDYLAYLDAMLAEGSGRD